MEKSTHQCPAFLFNYEETEVHPNADRLRLWKIPGSDYTYVLNKDDWTDYKGMVVWAPPDSLLDTTRPEFAWLADEAKYDETSNTPGKYARIKAKRLRGQVSYGLLTKIPDTFSPSDNVAADFGIVHYEQELADSRKRQKDPLGLGNGETAKAPSIVNPYYDVDSFLKYGRKVFQEGELVNISLKIHGENWSAVYHDGEFHVRSREQWKREFTTAPEITLEELIERMKKAEENKPIKSTEEEINIRAKAIFEKRVTNFKPNQSKWWWTLRNTPGLTDFLQANPNVIVFGEQYGHNKGHKGDTGKEPLKLRLFDVIQNGQFMDIAEAREFTKGLPWVPELATNWPLDFNNLEQFYTGPSPLGDKVREGCVIRSMKEESTPYGRKIFKIVNPDY